jgi:hypothetical protein
MMRRFASVILLTSAFVLIKPASSFACHCIPSNSQLTASQKVSRAATESKAVFSGRVIEVNPRADYVEVKFKVEKSWKHTSVGEITITTGLGHSDCGYGFQIGESFLVYAYRSRAGRLETNTCTRTQRLDDAGEDLRFLPGWQSRRKRKS